jgi:chromate reductase
MNSAPLRILALPGSLRVGSVNAALLRAAAKLAPAQTVVTLFKDLAGVPLFNEDLEVGPLPAAVVKLRSSIEESDGVLIATPEYNNSIPGVLKNAIDWLSRPAPTKPLVGKPIAVIGATTGGWGTRLAQAALRQVLFSTESLVLPSPGLFVRVAGGVFDADGTLIDSASIHALSDLMKGFNDWIKRMKLSSLPPAPD